jgi:hypothetical protein
MCVKSACTPQVGYPQESHNVFLPRQVTSILLAATDVQSVLDLLRKTLLLLAGAGWA